MGAPTFRVRRGCLSVSSSELRWSLRSRLPPDLKTTADDRVFSDFGGALLVQRALRVAASASLGPALSNRLRVSSCLRSSRPGTGGSSVDTNVLSGTNTRSAII